ncbi:MAG: hypothetical protein HC771_10810 [Synechococcales cyanobacterium CRU_2_2]|nr:hypothetical protein [Synechococcales cyanobacterium CRU_2_2]
MSSLTPLEQLAVEAFAIALEICREENVELPGDIWALENDLESQAGELSAIAQTHPQLQACYRTARNMLRRESGDRNKRLYAPEVGLERAPEKTLDAPQIGNPSALGEANRSTQSSSMQSNGNSPEQNAPQAVVPQPIVVPQPSPSDSTHLEAEPSLDSRQQDVHRLAQRQRGSAKASAWENFDRIAIMAAGGAFLGGAVVQLFGGGVSQLLGALLGAIVGCWAGFYVAPKTTHSNRNP